MGWCLLVSVTYSWVLTGVRGEVLEGPLDVLVRSQLPGEGRGLLAAQAQDAVVGGQHPAVEEHHILVVVVREDVIEGNVLGHHGVLHDKAHVLGAVHAHVVPEGQQGLLVVVGGDGRLRELRLEEVPQVHEVGGEHESLGFGDQTVRHETEVGHQFGGAVNSSVNVELGS